MLDKTRWAALAAVASSWLLAGLAHAQGAVGGGLPGEELAEREWMTTGLAPLVLLLGLGIAVALVAAAIAAFTITASKRRSGPRYGGPSTA